MKKKKYNHIINSYYGHATYDYDSYTSGEGYETRTHITGGRIEEVNYNSIYNQISGRMSVLNIRDYCLNRFINRNIKKDSFSFETSSGYYGDEAGIELNSKAETNINFFIDQLNGNISNNDLVESVLIDEYGFILDELKGKTWHFGNILLKNIIPSGGMRHTSKELIDKYIKDDWQLSCVCQKLNNQFRLIDGYHRYSAAIKLGNSKITGIYCE